jgi:type I restriction enzyme S subunit
MINYEQYTLPSHWPFKKLGDIADFLDEKRIPIKELDRAEMHGEYPYYGASGIIDYVNDYIFDGEFILLGEDGANILTRSLPLAFIVTGRIWVNNHAHVIKPRKDVDTKFLTEYLNSISYEIYNTGTAQPKLPQSTCLKIEVICPPLAEQREIAEILGTWDAAIATVERMVAALRERKRGLMQRLLTGEMRFPGFERNAWKEIGLGDCVQPVSRIEPVKPDQDYHLLGVRWYLEGAHIHDVVCGDKVVTHALSRIHENDIVYNKMWVSKGAFAVAKAIHHGAYGSSEYPTFIAKDNLDVRYLEYAFHDSRFLHDAKALCRGTTGRIRLNPDDFLKLTILLPSREEQTKIATVLQTVQQEIDQSLQYLRLLKEQKRALMQRLLTGQVRVAVADDSMLASGTLRLVAG